MARRDSHSGVVRQCRCRHVERIAWRHWRLCEGHPIKSLKDPRAIDVFAENNKLTPDIARRAVQEFYPKEGLQIGEIKGLDLTLQDALDYKFVPSAKTAQDIAPLFDILSKPGR